MPAKKSSAKTSAKKSNVDDEKDEEVMTAAPSVPVEADAGDEDDDDIDIPVTTVVTSPTANDTAEAPSFSRATPEQRQRATSAAQDTVIRITDVVLSALDQLEDGKKTTLKELQALVADKTGLKGSNIGPVISMIVKTHPDVSVELGRYGGIYRGHRVRPEKPVDTKPRCLHCNQVIRQKTGKRKKKNPDGTLLAATTTTEASAAVDDLDDDALDDEDDDLDDDDDGEDDEDDAEAAASN